MSFRVVLQSCLLAAVVVTAVSVAPGEVSAQTADQRRKAKEHFEKARRLYDVGKYKDAIEEYQKAYLNIEDPVFLFNIAQSYRLDNQPQEAVRFYKNYLRRNPDAENRADVERKIEELSKADSTSPPPPDGTTPPPPDGTITPPVTTTPPPLTTTPPPVTTTPPPVTTAPPNGSTPDVTLGDSSSVAEPQGSSKKTLGVSLIIAGGALVAVSAVTGVLANGKAKDQEKKMTFDPDLESSGKALSSIAVVTGLTGLAAGVIGTVFLLKSRSSSPSEGSTDVAIPEPRLTLYPMAGPSFAGAGARMRF